MKINEVERITDITSKNIRFYEKQGLLSPARSTDNRYREFSDEDVRKLKEIKLLRRIGVGLSDIKSIQDGEMSLTECMDTYLRFFTKQKKDLDKVIGLCENIQKSETDIETIDADFYLNRINFEEEKGARFVNITRDFITRAKGVLPVKPKTYFEPDEPILNQQDFMKELEKWAQRSKKSITFVSMGMRPTILLDGDRYICSLEIPMWRPTTILFSLGYATKFNFGYKWVYLYEDFSADW